MTDYSGLWTGEIRGTNVGGIAFRIIQVGNDITGTGTIHEPMTGPYTCVITGRAGPQLEARLVPRATTTKLHLGTVNITAAFVLDGSLAGTWRSDAGTHGAFSARREYEPANKTPSRRVGERNSQVPPVPAEAPDSRQPRVLRKGMEIDEYKLVQRLGKGFSGEVWKATVERPPHGVDLSPNSTVAMKFYHVSMYHGFETIRIQREFKIATDVIHSNLARVYDLVLSPNRPFYTFMVMEYVEGETLKKHVERTGIINHVDVLSIARQLFSALEELHSNGAIHRDVKSANIMIENADKTGPTIKLVDLGIVAMKQEDRFTAPSSFLGSKHSAPFEQLVAGEIDERVDIYGAGSVLFHCLRGSPMYADVGPEGAIVHRMLKQPDQLALDQNKPFDPLVPFVNKCIAVNASDRPTTARECLAELDRISR